MVLNESCIDVFSVCMCFIAERTESCIRVKLFESADLRESGLLLKPRSLLLNSVLFTNRIYVCAVLIDIHSIVCLICTLLSYYYYYEHCYCVGSVIGPVHFMAACHQKRLNADLVLFAYMHSSCNCCLRLSSPHLR